VCAMGGFTMHKVCACVCVKARERERDREFLDHVGRCTCKKMYKKMRI